MRGQLVRSKGQQGGEWAEQGRGRVEDWEGQACEGAAKAVASAIES